MSKLAEKLMKASVNKYASIMSESKLYNNKATTPTDLPILNIALAGTYKGGLGSGLTMIAGPSKHFKSLLGLFMVKSYLDADKDAVCIFFDSEFGTPQSYLNSFGIDPNRVIHSPIQHIEQLKFEMSSQLDAIDRGDKVIIFIDSIGNLASKKEVEDALEQKSAADMTRAKQLKSLWRIATPQFRIKDIPCIAINHTYESQGMFPTAVVSGGTGGIYSSDTIFIISRSQEKDTDGLTGYKFTINIEKSRYVREKSKLPFSVDFKSGIDKWSGLLDIALELGFVTKPSNGWYVRTVVTDDKKWRAKDTSCYEFWKPILEESNFEDAIMDRYGVGSNASIIEEDHEVSEEDVSSLFD